MLEVVKVASYIVSRYRTQYGRCIDEMKLHKLLYFAQRESFVLQQKPLFDTAFHAWKYGPVIVEIRTLYKQGKLNEGLSDKDLSIYQGVFDQVFERYAYKDSWTLSSISHGEISWQNARIGIPADENSDELMSLEDIRKDAQRIKDRRYWLSRMQVVSSNA
jgi:uncharacterized phage-associated protein